jgi:hypothetical protein
MRREGNRSSGRRALAGAPRWLLAPLLALLLSGGCDRPFQPIPENPREPFWIFGYLDLRADTQCVRVMPVRQNLLTDPDPIDALVTLEEVGSGRVVTLTDSLFRFTDERLGGVAYAHNFWTTEPLHAKGKYRIRAVRSDGAETTALVEMPSDLELSFLNLEGGGDTSWVEIRAERVLLVETWHAMMTLSGEPAGSIARRQPQAIATGDPGKQVLNVDGTPAFREGLVDVDRKELHVATVRSDWPYDPRVPNQDAVLPGSMPSNVENGVGFVGGVATMTIPYHRCEAIAPRPDRQLSCAITYNARSASIAGTLIREPCGGPHRLAEIRLRETFAGGGGAVLTWRSGWKGEYRFEGIEPGAELVLQPGPGTPDVPLPRLAPGQRYDVGEIPVTAGC